MSLLGRNFKYVPGPVYQFIAWLEDVAACLKSKLHKRVTKND